jgi:molecular chaperone GrpE (heat shock protein)
MDASQPDGDYLSLSEIRQVVSRGREGGGGPLSNLQHATRSAYHLCEAIVRSPAYQSLRTRPPTLEEFESDLACVIASYRWLLARIEKSRLAVKIEKVRVLEDSLDANFRNLLKALPRYAPSTSKRLSKIQPSKPEEAARVEPYVDRDLARAGRRIEASASADELLDLAGELLEKREELVRQIRERPAPRSPLPGEGLMRGLIRCLLALERVLEGFRAIPTSPELKAWLSSAENIRHLFESFLNKHGVYRMDVEGTRLDLDAVEVVEKVFTSKAEHHHVTKVVSDGFYYLGKPIKVARVGVAVRPESE